MFRSIMHMDISTFQSLVRFLWSDDWPGQLQPSIIKKNYHLDIIGSHSIEMIVACGVVYMTGSDSNSINKYFWLTYC